MIYCNWQSLSIGLFVMAFCWIVCWSSVDKISCGQTVSCGFSQWIDGTTEWTSAPSMPGFWLRQGWPHQYQGGVGTSTFSMITWPGDLIWSMFVLLICYIHSSLLITADLEYPPKKIIFNWLDSHVSGMGWDYQAVMKLDFRKNSSIDTISWSSPHLLRSSRVGFQEAIAVLTWK